MRNKIVGGVAALVMLLAVLFVGMGAASATAPGTVNVGNTCNSAGSIEVLWENNYSGSRYNQWLGACRSSGEGTGAGNGTSEPLAYRTRPGWCSIFQIEINGSNGPWSSVIGGGDGTGVWTGIHPGNGFNGKWHARLHTWNC